MEIACGAALEQVLAAAGGPSEPLQAVLIGGFHGTWVAAADFAGVTLDNEWMSQIGGSLGAGVVVALPGTACPVSELADTIGWLAEHSAHQCGPCSNGLPALAGLLALMGAGQAPPYARDQLRRWGGDLVGRGACRLPDGAVRFLSSGMRVFAGELAQHERHGPCVACRGRRTLVPAPIRRARR
jgi:NADH:ubiquinone oxidoreductase subunit F (NADH-binding)